MVVHCFAHPYAWQAPRSLSSLTSCSLTTKSRAQWTGDPSCWESPLVAHCLCSVVTALAELRCMWLAARSSTTVSTQPTCIHLHPTAPGVDPRQRVGEHLSFFGWGSRLPKVPVCARPRALQDDGALGVFGLYGR
jgi:hypothetical protein